ncbi:MAG: ester cyclase [Acidobacteria bacterium]|nr:ester cyclase [Acidobacteriota bacterium]MBS1865606.1 ester cyclase [Acidobacteriota bacterium]
MNLPNKTIVKKFYQEVWNEKKVKAAQEWLSPSHALVDPNASDTLTGPEAYKTIVDRFMRAFSELKFEVQDMVCEKDKVVASWVISGVHTGEYNGLPPTNKKISVEGISIHQIADGKIMDTYSVWDTLGLLKKVGGVVTVEKVAVAGKARGN